MDRIEPIRPSIPPIDATRVRKVLDEREQRAGARQQAEQEQRRRNQARPQQDGEREWSTDEELQEDEDQDGPPRIDVRA
ncbi:MAG TPA: hypothetical protein VGP17_00980 [Solirubrobacteraceae bacterium]|nr:hypothetical protein [Solirubrobacteraceae bacterium]